MKKRRPRYVVCKSHLYPAFTHGNPEYIISEVQRREDFYYAEVEIYNTATHKTYSFLEFCKAYSNEEL